MFGAGCVNAGHLAAFLLMLLYFLGDLAAVAAANLEPARVGKLYASAALQLRGLSFRSPDPSASHAIGLHVGMLESLSRTREFQARAFGVPVTFAVVRTAAATMLTVGIGLWSVLRGAGIGVTVESVCPGGGQG
ncbi:hypothetical protein DFJ74DRAFT_693468 [Hyaloraphidium curvatum]|nr:hypothetical protein DFJ74DRAFT_693468 [Hyaloraphidium curvatum]